MVKVPAAQQSGGKLSELAQQLRALQASNSRQESEIERLQRQLQIMADLSGVSVADLQSSLRNACESKAFAELHSQLKIVQNQLEEERFVREKEAQHSALTVSKELESRRIANYELRIGELEELIEADRMELADSYDAVQASNSECCRLHILCEEQQKALTELRQKLSRTGEHCTDLVVADSDSQSNQFAMIAKPDQDNVVRTQLMQREKELALKEAQYTARFSLQDTRITDLEQQLSSLYTAFGIVDDERSKEQSSRQKLAEDLHSADEQIAKTLEQMDQKSVRSAETPLNSPSYQHAQSAVEHQTALSPRASHSATPRASYSASPRAPYSASPTASYSASPQGQHLTTVQPQPTSNVILAGPVLKRGSLNRWKKRHITLVQQFTCFLLRISEPNGDRKATSYKIDLFRSEVAIVAASHPFACRVTLDTSDRNSAVLDLAFPSESVFKQWISALRKATFGTAGDEPASPTGSSLVSPDDSDLEAALRESLRVG